MQTLDRSELMAIIESWPMEERQSFVQELYDRMSSDSSDSDLTDELKAELDRRVEAFRKNPERAIPLEQALAQTMARFKK